MKSKVYMHAYKLLCEYICIALNGIAVFRVALHLDPQTNRDLPTKTRTLRYQTPSTDYEWAKTETWLMAGRGGVTER